MIESKNVCKINQATNTTERISVQEFLSIIARDSSMQVFALSVLLEGSVYHYGGYQYLIKELVQKKIEETKKHFS